MGAPRWPVLAAAVMVGVVSGGGAAGLGRGVAARPEAVGVVLGEGSTASFIGGQGGRAGSRAAAASTAAL